LLLQFSAVCLLQVIFLCTRTSSYWGYQWKAFCAKICSGVEPIRKTSRSDHFRGQDRCTQNCPLFFAVPNRFPSIHLCVWGSI